MSIKLRKSLTLFLSVLTAFCVGMAIIPSLINSKNVFAETPVYYVKADGDDAKDGKNTDTPKKTIGGVITQIKSDGLDNKGQNVIVKVIRLENEPTTWSSAEENSKFVDYYSTAIKHNASITYTSLDTTDTSTYSTIAYYNSFGNNVYNLSVLGPSRFEKINLLDQRTDGATKSIFAQGFELSFSDCVYLINQNPGQAFVSLNQKLSVYTGACGYLEGEKKVSGDGTIKLEEYNYNQLVLGGLIDNAYSYSNTINGEINLEIAGGSVKKVMLSDYSGGATGCCPVYKGNVNLIANGSTVIEKIVNGTCNGTEVIPVVNGAIQIILNDSASITGGTTGSNFDVLAYSNEEKTDYAPIFVINNNSGSSNRILPVAGEAGTFNTDNKKAYFYLSEGEQTTVYYATGNITLKESGAYSVCFDESDLPSPSKTDDKYGDYEFDKWVDNNDGTMTATFKLKSQKTQSYYVLSAGTGLEPSGTFVGKAYDESDNELGRSPEKPLATVKDAIKLINADGMSHVDDVTVYIMQLPYESGWWNTTDTLALSPLTAWSDEVVSFSSKVPTHQAVIKITTYNYSGTNNYLGYTAKLGQNADMLLGGPVVFENITLVGMRYGDSRICANGYDATFGEGFDYCNVYADQYGTTTWDGTFNKDAGFRFEAGTGQTSMSGKGGVITVNAPIVANGNVSKGFNMGSYIGTKNNSFTDHVHYVFDNDNLDVNLLFGIQKIDYQLLTLEVKSAAGIGFANRNLNIQTVNNLQVIALSGQKFYSCTANEANNWYYRSECTINGIEGCMEYEKGWFITLAENGYLEATDTAGKFKIADGKVAIATNLSTQLITMSNKGLLDLSNSPAKYTVRFVQESDINDELVAVYYDGVLAGNKLKGETFNLSQGEDKLLQKFVGWSDGSTTYTAGLSYIIPVDFAYATLSFSSVYTNYENQAVIFVDKVNGNDDNNGLSASAAVKTVSKAITLLESVSADKKIVGVIGEYVFDESQWAAHTETIYISGDGSTESETLKSRIIFNNGNSCVVNGPTTFENIRLHKNNGAINAENHKLILGTNVVCAQSDGIVIKAGKANGTFDIEINSGYVYGVYLSTDSKTESTVLGGNFVMNGGTVLLFYFGNSGVKTVFTQNVNVVVNGNAVIQLMGYEIYDFDVEFAKTATVQYIVNGNNAFPTYYYGDKIENLYFLSNFYCDSCKILPTNEVGKYSISGDKYAVFHYQPHVNANYSAGTKVIAVKEDGTPSDTITLLSGIWSVKFHDSVDYINSLGKITVYKDNTYIDLSKELYKEKGIFMGWEVCTKNGTPTFTLNADGYYDAGTTITAKFIECDYNGLFFIEGAQIKKGGAQAIRFVISQNKAVEKAVKQIADSYTFGAVYLETDYIGGNELVKGGEYSIDTMSGYYLPDNGRVEGVKYTAKHQEISSYYKNTSELYKYVFTLSDIADEDLYTFYTVRGYLEYTDKNGNTNVIYTAYKTVNLYKIAKMASADTESGFTATDKAEFERIKNYVETTRIENYFGVNGDGSIVGKTTPDDADENHTIYTTKNGLRVRKVNIEWDYNDEDTDNYEIVQISDTHFSGIDDVDRLEGTTTTVDTYEKYGYRYPQDSHNAIKVMEYGSMADKVIVTGDIFDSQSHYSMAKTKYLLIDKNVSVNGETNNVLLLTGNHEHTQNTSGVIREIFELDRRIDIRDEFFETNSNNCVYYSEVVKNSNGYNRAMIILMDNQRDLYYEYMVEFLTADLQLARSLNIPVLIFQHDPICSKNPNEQSLPVIGEENLGSGNPGGIYNLYNKNGLIGGPSPKDDPNDKEATQEIYDIIVNNSDIIKGIFCGHTHNNYYSEIICPNGDIIPQYILNTTYDISNISSANTLINSGTLLHITLDNK